MHRRSSTTELSEGFVCDLRRQSAQLKAIQRQVYSDLDREVLWWHLFPSQAGAARIDACALRFRLLTGTDHEIRAPSVRIRAGEDHRARDLPALIQAHDPLLAVREPDRALHARDLSVSSTDAEETLVEHERSRSSVLERFVRRVVAVGTHRRDRHARSTKNERDDVRLR